jgi:phosphotransferase system enzyme I (PtsI)
MVSGIDEVKRAKAVLADCMEELRSEKIPCNEQLKVGIMIEVPATTMITDLLAKEVDFFSIGTNDLIQYTLAVDRSNKDVVGLYNASDPAVLKLIKMTIDAARRRQIAVSLCGQMSGSATYAMLLLGMGLRQFSVSPAVIPEIKKICRSVAIPQCEAVAERALAMDSARDIKSFLRGELKKHVPELGA